MFYHYIDPLVKLQINLTPLLANLEKLVIDICSQKADFVLMKDNFNARSWKWSFTGMKTPEEAQPDPITSLYGMK